MILSDRELQAEIDAGRIVIEPFDPSALQPSSIDLRVGNQFRVFHNARYPYIDVKKPMDDLTELVEVSDEEPFILHPGEFVLATTLETVTLPDNLVARLEGKSSLGRLGLLIHSSLPGDEQILLLHDGSLSARPISEIVHKRLDGYVVSFDPETFAVGYHAVTGWHESPPDRIFEVVLASGRKVRVTAGHCLFGLDRDGELTKLRVGQLAKGSRVAIPRTIPEPSDPTARIDLVVLAPEAARRGLVCGGPTVAALLADRPRDVRRLLSDEAISHVAYYCRREYLPLHVALPLLGSSRNLEATDWLAVRGGRHRLPAVIDVDEDLAWMLGLYVAEGYRRRNQVTISNRQQAILDRAQATLARLGLPVCRSEGSLTCCSALFSDMIGWLGTGERARDKRVPDPLLGWPTKLVHAFLEGFIDGGGSREATRTSLWTSSRELVSDLLLVCERLGRRAAASVRTRSSGFLWQISVPHGEHKLLTAVPIPDRLLVSLRRGLGLTQKAASEAVGFRSNTQLNNLERLSGSALRLATLRRLRAAYRGADPADVARLDRLVDGDLLWDVVADVHDTGEVEPVFDLEVRPGGRPIENFLAGEGGVFVSNTAGFVDAGFSGQLTLELSNVANLPITIYPAMRVGQLCVFQMTSPAQAPYGARAAASKYQGQRGPTPSRYFENFR